MEEDSACIWGGGVDNLALIGWRQSRRGGTFEREEDV